MNFTGARTPVTGTSLSGRDPASAGPAHTEPPDVRRDVEETLQPIPEDQRTTKVAGQFWIWAGANIAPINWVLGALGISMGLGLWDTFGVLVAGNVLGMVVFGLFVLLGQRSGVTGMLLGRGVFGRRGNYLPAVIQATVVIGWCAVNTWIVLDLVMALFGKIGLVDPTLTNYGWKFAVAAAVMAVQVTIALFGYRAISAFERWTVPPTIAILVAMSVAAWVFMDIDWSYAGPPTGALTGWERIVAMSSVMTAIGVGWGLTWLTYASDYSRFVSKTVPRKKLYLASAGGQILPVLWLGLLGATLATTNGSVDPGKLIVDNFGALAIPVLLLVLHGPIATNILNIYTFTVTIQSLDVRIGRRALNIGMGVATMGAVTVFVFSTDIASSLDAWLSACVGWTSTWGAIVGVRYYLLDRHSTDFGHHFDPVGTHRLRDVDWRALVAFGTGLLCAWLFMHGMVPALQGPVSTALHGLDLSWLAAAISSGGVYYLLVRKDPTLRGSRTRTGVASGTPTN
ncbi:cytosine permease [Georgenia yuyongxinii]|uniref:Cytosine permease n=1 Tax=Georgenia yuyongxinii TaxID=2589797 RepID=A0A5B8CAL4_9MICO|nr:cytosine permease [Georgenia yuyongxinii]QDC26485.1 cytosine permease [Georgenia yuyongxinii]